MASLLNDQDALAVARILFVARQRRTARLAAEHSDTPKTPRSQGNHQPAEPIEEMPAESDHAHV